MLPCHCNNGFILWPKTEIVKIQISNQNFSDVTDLQLRLWKVGTLPIDFIPPTLTSTQIILNRKYNKDRDLKWSGTAYKIRRVSHASEVNNFLDYDLCVSLRASRIDDLIALQALPFNFLEGIGFRRLLQFILPNYQLRGRQSFMSFICDELYLLLLLESFRLT